MKYLVLVIILAAMFLGHGSPVYYVNSQRAIGLYADPDCSLTINSGEEPTAYAVYDTETNKAIVGDCLARNHSVSYMLLSNHTYVVVVYGMHGEVSCRYVVIALKSNNHIVDFL